MSDAEKKAAGRIARAIEKGTGYSMESAARIAEAAILYIRAEGLAIMPAQQTR